MNIWLKSWDLLTMEKLGFIPPLDECSLYNSYSYHFFLGVQCLALFWSPSQIHPEWSHPLLSSCGNKPPLCETQLPGGIHRTCQKDRPEGKLHSPGTHCWLKWERATLQSHCLVPQKHTATKREANNINGLHAQLLPNADHLPVPWAPFEHDLQCFSSDTFLCLPRHCPTGDSVLSVPGNSGSRSPGSSYHHPSLGFMVFSPLPCAAWEVLLTMPAVCTPNSYCPL